MSLAEDFDRAGRRFESAEAFLRWAEVQPERWELVDGFARMMTGGTANHSRIARNALTHLTTVLASGPCEPFGSDFAVALADGHVSYPDVSVSCDQADSRTSDDPVVVIEVLSPSTAGYDAGRKAAAYRRLPSLRHLLLIRQDRIAVAHYHRDAGARDFTLTEVDRVDAAIPLPAVGAALPVAALYARVRFGP